MQAIAYGRAARLLGSPRDPVVARILGVVESLLIVVMLGVVALFVALMASRGEARIPVARVPRLPAWLETHRAGVDRDHLLYDDTGIIPLVSDSLDSPNVVHRYGARALIQLTRALPTLQNNRGALGTLLATGLILLVTIVIISIWRRTVVARASADVATALRRQIHRQMYRLGQSALPTEGVGPVINLWTREVNDVRDGLFADLHDTPRLQVLGGGLLVVALLVSPLLTVFLAAVGLLTWLTARKMEADARMAADAALWDASIQLVLLHEDLGLLRTVRVFSVEEYDRERFDEHLERYRTADERRIVSSGPLSPSTILLFGASIALALALLGHGVLIGKQIGIGTMLVLFVALTGLAYPIAGLIRQRQAIRQANRSAGGIFEFLERKPELHQDVGAHFLEPPRDQIVLENVVLESRSGRALLEGASVEIPARARTSLLGMQEDFKLALACLLPRLIDPKSGRVLIDGRDLRSATLESIRAQVAIVLQADLVFTDSVLVNIGLGEPMNTLPRVIDAAKVTHAHHFIQDLPHGYDTIVGPLGHYLKADEQFRIALARAYLHDPSILIVEEPKESLDSSTQHFIDDTLTRLSIGRTVIVIPHRLSSVRNSDYAVVLHDGRVEDAGSPARLQAESKLYRHLMYTEFNEYAAAGEIEGGQMNHAESSRRGVTA